MDEAAARGGGWEGACTAGEAVAGGEPPAVGHPSGIAQVGFGAYRDWLVAARRQWAVDEWPAGERATGEWSVEQRSSSDGPERLSNETLTAGTASGPRRSRARQGAGSGSPARADSQMSIAFFRIGPPP
jgi:hypothetical protein